MLKTIVDFILTFAACFLACRLERWIFGDEKKVIQKVSGNGNDVVGVRIDHDGKAAKD